MQKSAVLSLFFLLSLTLGAAPGETTIDTTLNKIIGVHHLAGSMAKLKELHDWPDRKFVVVHFGDSHIQGDNLTGAIRSNLQSVYGDGGEGVLFPYSLCKSFGPKSLISSSTGTWTWATVLKPAEVAEVGVTGYSLITQDSNASLTFRYSPEAIGVGCSTVSFWYAGDNSTVFLKNAGPGVTLEHDESIPMNGLRRAIVHGYKIGTDISFRFKRSVPKGSFDFKFYGISFDRDSGLEYNRCGVVGATFLQLTRQDGILLRHLKVLKPDLIIFSYGSNESYNTALDKDAYSTQVERFIRDIRAENPEVNFIITSPPDTRSANRFPVNTQWICDSLKVICERQECGFWDMHSIMGGNESIYFWLNNSLARKDKLHFTKAGYELQGNLFSQALLQAYKDDFTLDELPQLKTVTEKITAQLSSLTASGAAPKVVVVSGNEHEHIVKKGETLSIIARDNKVTVDQLCEWNNIKKTDVLKIGQRIVIKK